MGRRGYLLSLLGLNAGLSIGLLWGLTGCADGQTHQAPVKRTEALLQIAGVLSTEYRAKFHRPVNHAPAKGGIDWSKPRSKNASSAKGKGIPDDSIERFVWAAWQVERLQTQLNSLVASASMVDSDGDGFLELVDGWGNKIAYAAYVKHDDDFPDDDYFPSTNRPVFMSAGPNGLWGSYAPGNKANDAAEDNIRSDRSARGG
jgi:hypothetical protein